MVGTRPIRAVLMCSASPQRWSGRGRCNIHGVTSLHNFSAKGFRRVIGLFCYQAQLQRRQAKSMTITPWQPDLTCHEPLRFEVRVLSPYDILGIGSSASRCSTCHETSIMLWTLFSPRLPIELRDPLPRQSGDQTLNTKNPSRIVLPRKLI